MKDVKKFDPQAYADNWQHEIVCAKCHSEFTCEIGDFWKVHNESLMYFACPCCGKTYTARPEYGPPRSLWYLRIDIWRGAWLYPEFFTAWDALYSHQVVYRDCAS